MDKFIGGSMKDILVLPEKEIVKKNPRNAQVVYATKKEQEVKDE